MENIKNNDFVAIVKDEEGKRLHIRDNDFKTRKAFKECLAWNGYTVIDILTEKQIGCEFFLEAYRLCRNKAVADKCSQEENFNAYHEWVVNKGKKYGYY